MRRIDEETILSDNEREIMLENLKFTDVNAKCRSWMFYPWTGNTFKRLVAFYNSLGRILCMHRKLYTNKINMIYASFTFNIPDLVSTIILIFPPFISVCLSNEANAKHLD